MQSHENICYDDIFDEPKVAEPAFLEIQQELEESNTGISLLVC